MSKYREWFGAPKKGLSHFITKSLDYTEAPRVISHRNGSKYFESFIKRVEILGPHQCTRKGRCKNCFFSCKEIPAIGQDPNQFPIRNGIESFLLKTGLNQAIKKNQFQSRTIKRRMLVDQVEQVVSIQGKSQKFHNHIFFASPEEWFQPYCHLIDLKDEVEQNNLLQKAFTKHFQIF